MIEMRQKGNFKKLNTFMQKVQRPIRTDYLNQRGKAGVLALQMNTPQDSGKTSESWYYEIEETSDGISINFCNSNVNDGVPIAIILQYGHGTATGGYVQGRDYINPAIRPIFDELLYKVWRGVTV